LRAEHETIDDECVLVAEQIGERCRAAFTLEGVFLLTSPPGGKARRRSATRSM
jgi:hypothetical protein